MNLSRIQKTTTFIVIALATLGAVGVMGAMITTATTADARPFDCFIGPHGTICPGPPEGIPRCILTPQREICPGPP